MPKGQWQEFRFVCREYRGLEVLCAWNAKGGNTLLGLRGKVSDVAYEKAVEEVTNEVMIKTRQDDIQLIEGTKNWIDQPQRKASEKEKNYAKNRLDGVIKKIMKAMTAVQTVKDSLLQPKTKVKVVNEIKEKARPSIMSRLAEKKKELAEREANKKNDLKKSWNRDDR